MKLSEDDIIEIFKEFIDHRDDVGIAFPEKKKYIISSIDSFVSITDMPPGMPYRAASYKALLSALSDLYIKGVSPSGILVSLGLPPLSLDELNDLKEGFKYMLSIYKIPHDIIKKWDTNRSEHLFISIAAYGFSDFPAPSWSEAKLGDFIYVGGLFGLERLGLEILLNKNIREDIPAELRNIALSSFLYPKPNLHLYESVIKDGLANASIDSSDGLIRSLYLLSRESEVKIVIEKVPAHPLLLKYEDILGNRYIQELTLYGGEEYIGIFSVSPDSAKELDRLPDLYRIGYVGRGDGVYLKKDDALIRLEDKGYQHSFST
jgi:thiamin-phosphate kinase